MASSTVYTKADEAAALNSNETSTPVCTPDAGVQSKRALRAFLKKQVEDAKGQGVQFTPHVKATMTKVSDPILFAHLVSVFFEDVFEKYEATFCGLDVSASRGLGDLFNKMEGHALEADILSDMETCCARRPELAVYWVQALAEQVEEAEWYEW
jgi:monomeric isocitrate dehydrogenase